MLEAIRKLHSRTLYVQIWENRIKVTNIDSGKVFDEAPVVAIETTAKGGKRVCAFGNAATSKAGPNIALVNPFSHPRVPLADFTIGEKLLQSVFREVLPPRLVPTLITVVIHPMEKIEGGLTQIELRAFWELALNAGARKAALHVGPELPRQGFEEALGRMSQPDWSVTDRSRNLRGLEIAFYLGALVIGLAYIIFKELT